mmetsp:Transcript_118600/g.272121  ORF Transcript_118600/g.272121 Transcript_118600/m.272121 type:complete len:296 (-) Transcript_118600:169-1056(-)
MEAAIPSSAPPAETTSATPGRRCPLPSSKASGWETTTLSHHSAPNRLSIPLSPPCTTDPEVSELLEPCDDPVSSGTGGPSSPGGGPGGGAGPRTLGPGAAGGVVGPPDALAADSALGRSPIPTVGPPDAPPAHSALLRSPAPPVGPSDDTLAPDCVLVLSPTVSPAVPTLSRAGKLILDSAEARVPTVAPASDGPESRPVPMGTTSCQPRSMGRDGRAPSTSSVAARSNDCSYVVRNSLPASDKNSAWCWLSTSLETAKAQAEFSHSLSATSLACIFIMGLALATSTRKLMTSAL